MTEKRFHASQAHRLDAPERFMWLPPAEVIAALAIQAGDTIADIGAGTGYFALPMADAAGPLGKVYAVDAQAEMLEHLRAKLETNETANVELVHAEADATGLPGATCNLLLLANVWHEFDDHAAVLLESKRVLAPGGRIAILDWRPDVERDAGPPLDHRIPAAHCMQDLLTAGFINTAHKNTGKYSWLVQGKLPR